MKTIIRTGLAMLVFANAPLVLAQRTCVEALQPVSAHGMVSLPAACRSMGPVALGMPKSGVLEALGRPDREAASSGVTELIYVFPRDMAVRLREHPESESYFWSRVGFMRVAFKEGEVVSIGTYGASIPYSVPGVAIGADVDRLLGETRLKPDWNPSKDNASFAPYPFEISTDEGGMHVEGVTIATREMIFGPWPGFRFTVDRSTGLATGYRMVFP